VALSSFFGRALQKLALQPGIQNASDAQKAAFAANPLIMKTGVSLDPVLGKQLYDEAHARQDAATLKTGALVLAAAAPALTPYIGASGAKLVQTLVPRLAAAAAPKPATVNVNRSPSMSLITDESGNFSFGAAAETLLQIALNRSATPDYGPVAQAPLMTQAAFPTLPSLGSLLGGAGRVVGAAIGAVRSVSGRVVGFILANGRRVSVKDAAALAAQVGITAAAATLGASETEVAEAVLAAMKHRGKGRGISAAQLRITRRTIGKLERAHKQIAKAARQHTR
jgi:hypothetical protein